MSNMEALEHARYRGWLDGDAKKVVMKQRKTKAPKAAMHCEIMRRITPPSLLSATLSCMADMVMYSPKEEVGSEEVVSHVPAVITVPEDDQEVIHALTILNVAAVGVPEAASGVLFGDVLREPHLEQAAAYTAVGARDAAPPASTWFLSRFWPF